MSAAVTASAQRGIGWSRICRILGQNRSTYTARAARKQARGQDSAPARRGRPSKITDEALLIGAHHQRGVGRIQRGSQFDVDADSAGVRERHGNGERECGIVRDRTDEAVRPLRHSSFTTG